MRVLTRTGALDPEHPEHPERTTAARLPAFRVPWTDP